jgi:hypothetical protein
MGSESTPFGDDVKRASSPEIVPQKGPDVVPNVSLGLSLYLDGITMAAQVEGCRVYAEVLADSEIAAVGERTNEATKNRPEHSRRAALLWLDGEGVFECLHARFQVLDFAPLLFHEQVLNLPESYLNTVQADLDVVDVIFGGRGLEAFVDHDGELINGVLDGGLHILFGCRYVPIVVIGL